MAASCANLASLADATDAATYATASVSPTNGRAVLVTVINSKASAPDLATVSGCGQTWTQELDIARGTFRQTTFSAQIASASAGAITASFGGVTQTGCIIVVDEFTGADGTDAFLQPSSNQAGAATSLTVTIAGAFGAVGNGTYGVFSHNGNEITTVGSGFTGVVGTGATLGHASPTRAAGSEFRADNDASVDMSWATSSQCIGFAFEIKASAGATTYTKAGEAVSAFVASGADVRTAVETGGATSGFVASGADAVVFARTGEAVSGLVATGADAVVFARPGGAVAGLVASGVDAFTAARSGAAVMGLVGSGVSQKVGTGTTYVKAGSSTMGLAASGWKRVCHILDGVPAVAGTLTAALAGTATLSAAAAPAATTLTAVVAGTTDLSEVPAASTTLTLTPAC